MGHGFHAIRLLYRTAGASAIVGRVSNPPLLRRLGKGAMNGSNLLALLRDGCGEFL